MTSTIIAVGIAAGLLAAASPSSRGPVSPCSFKLATSQPTAEIVAVPEVTDRAWVMAQPDSPIAIVRVDLSGLRLVGGPGWFERSGRYVVDVTNISDQVITELEVMVRVGFGEGNGVAAGHGHRPSKPLSPGEHARIEAKAGPGRGTSPTTREATVVSLVSFVKTASCLYRPSQAWPAADDRQP